MCVGAHFGTRCSTHEDKVMRLSGELQVFWSPSSEVRWRHSSPHLRPTTIPLPGSAIDVEATDYYVGIVYVIVGDIKVTFGNGSCGDCSGTSTFTLMLLSNSGAAF